MILLFGALLGFISVAFGAYAEHGLRETITEEHFRFLMTAVRYNQIHAVTAVVVGFGLLNGGQTGRSPLLRWSGYLFIIGTILFSLSIYTSVTFDIPRLVNITPIGGITIMIAWLLLTLYGFRTMTARDED
ncbi:MAG TPA: DUF423 domain-containing protein [Betaproteobacteria bacterium]|jgi:uncharacterized membrane protein YgdD (TMEM256/DUF423 family)|nr:DUF423 domain-containing protein [Betaproteobacteria bacterium]|tara:strand:- start:2381 stop:2773 length:393 start_codon:yes stop_codon:yes gene_type:complete